MLPTYSNACSIPSAKDVLDHPLVIFVSSVIQREADLFERMSQENYQSYIAAVLKHTKKGVTPSGVDAVRMAAEEICKFAIIKHIELQSFESDALTKIANVSYADLHTLDYYISEYYSHLS